jgi:hypothetical protein
MACVLPPELDDQDLWKYLDGEAGYQVVAHLKGCLYCRERAERLARLQGRLINQLYRCTCPSPLELGEYHLDLLLRDQAEVVAQHLAECPHCAREVVHLENYLAELAPSLEPSSLERIKGQVRTLMAHLVSGGPGVEKSVQPVLVPAYAGLRGEEKKALIFQADDIQVAIKIQDDVKRPSRKAILGLVVGAALGGMKAHLWQDEHCIAEVPVDELGGFDIPDVTPGSYELILSSPEVEIHIRDLQLEAS